ncbi:unnamed protein product [Leptosia nina]|uniref:Uncharacterized protein n=1 Tax=Leptosia nina TaxID=320188 RepID=A0AAV1JS34_9NEOP
MESDRGLPASDAPRPPPEYQAKPDFYRVGYDYEISTHLTSRGSPSSRAGVGINEELHRGSGDDEGTGRRRPREPLAGLDGRVWRAGGAAPAAQAGGASAPFRSGRGRGRGHEQLCATTRVAAAAAAPSGARAQRVRGGATAGVPARPRSRLARRGTAAQAGDGAAGLRRRRQTPGGSPRRRLHSLRELRTLSLRPVREAPAAALKVALRLVLVQRGGLRGLRVVHVLREGALLPLRERRGRGGGAMRGRAAAGLRGRAVPATAVPVAVLAAAGVRGGGRGRVRALSPLRLPLPRAATALQYYLVPPRAPRRGARVVQIFIGERRLGPRGAGLSEVRVK